MDHTWDELTFGMRRNDLWPADVMQDSRLTVRKTEVSEQKVKVQVVYEFLEVKALTLSVSNIEQVRIPVFCYIILVTFAVDVFELEWLLISYRLSCLNHFFFETNKCGTMLYEISFRKAEDYVHSLVNSIIFVFDCVFSQSRVIDFT